MTYRFLIAVVVLSTGLSGHAFAREAAEPWSHRATHPLLLAKKWDELTPEEKKKVKEAREKYKNLPEDKKEQLRKKWEKMPKDEREKYRLERKFN